MDKAKAFSETVQDIDPHLSKMMTTMIEVCAYAGTGDVKKVHQLVKICSEKHGYDERMVCCLLW